MQGLRLNAQLHEPPTKNLTPLAPTWVLGAHTQHPPPFPPCAHNPAARPPWTKCAPPWPSCTHPAPLASMHTPSPPPPPPPVHLRTQDPLEKVCLLAECLVVGQPRRAAHTWLLLQVGRKAGGAALLQGGGGRACMQMMQIMQDAGRGWG